MDGWEVWVRKERKGGEKGELFFDNHLMFSGEMRMSRQVNACLLF